VEGRIIMDKLLNILKDICPDVDFENTTDLVDGGHLDSLDVITLVVELNESFNIEINVEDILPENFNSAEAIGALVDSLSD